MFVTLWEFEVKPGCEEEFEKVYGAEGEWARLFRKDGNYRETRLLKDVTRTRVYVTADFWTTRGAYEGFMKGHRSEYQALDAVGEGLTVKETKIDWFEGEG